MRKESTGPLIDLKSIDFWSGVPRGENVQPKLLSPGRRDTIASHVTFKNSRQWTFRLMNHGTLDLIYLLRAQRIRFGLTCMTSTWEVRGLGRMRPATRSPQHLNPWVPSISTSATTWMGRAYRFGSSKGGTCHAQSRSTLRNRIKLTLIPMSRSVQPRYPHHSPEV